MKLVPTPELKISFLQISREYTILDHTLINKLYINVAIVVILSQKWSLYDLQEPKYENPVYLTEGNLENLPCRV